MASRRPAQLPPGAALPCHLAGGSLDSLVDQPAHRVRGSGPDGGADRPFCGAPPARPGTFRDLCHGAGKLAAARQFPGGSRSDHRDAHLANEHGPGAAGQPGGPGLRLPGGRARSSGARKRPWPRCGGWSATAGTSSIGTTRARCIPSFRSTSRASTAATSPGICSPQVGLKELPDERIFTRRFSPGCATRWESCGGLAGETRRSRSSMPIWRRRPRTAAAAERLRLWRGRAQAARIAATLAQKRRGAEEWGRTLQRNCRGSPGRSLFPGPVAAWPMPPPGHRTAGRIGRRRRRRPRWQERLAGWIGFRPSAKYPPWIDRRAR